jgi:hypothetical protein
MELTTQGLLRVPLLVVLHGLGLRVPTTYNYNDNTHTQKSDDVAILGQ